MLATSAFAFGVPAQEQGVDRGRERLRGGGDEGGGGRVWISPDSETPDLMAMFQQPERWAESRRQIKVFKFGPRQVALGGKPPQNSIDDLARVDAFRKLESWGIAIAVEAPAIKPWDCTAQRAREMTANAIRSVNAAGGRLRYIAMDEPWTAGVGPCHDTFDGSVAKTAEYIKQLSNDPDLAAQGLTPEVGDIETYPAHSPAEIERWVSALEQRGAKPKFFHLDVNVHRLDVDHRIDAQRDLRELARFLRGERIPFGVIPWPGYNSGPSDRSFHDLTLAWTRRVGQAIGRPDQVIMQSWVVRGGAACSRQTRPATLRTRIARLPMERSAANTPCRSTFRTPTRQPSA